MASRKVPSGPPPKPPTVAPVRATELLKRQVETARALLSKPQVERLAFEGWEQTTRAVLAGAFGDPSENVTRFERASPAYPGRIGEDEQFWAQYRRDELEAKVSSVESGISQLEMGLGTSDATGAKPAQHHYETPRKVLSLLHGMFLELGHRSWSVNQDWDKFGSAGLDRDAVQKALRLLVTKGLAEYMGQAFVITEYGIRACDHSVTLDHELPVGDGASIGGVGQSPGMVAEFSELASVADLLKDDGIRDIVVRDLAELKVAVGAGLAKCGVLLGGSILEGVLIDVLDRNCTLASSYMKKQRRFPDDASLLDLIAIAGDAALLDAPRHLLTPTSVALAKAVTDHRDLIHPHAEARGRILVDEATARAVLHLLNLVVRDLVAAKARGDIEAYVNK